jgi:hypothetical protein
MARTGLADILLNLRSMVDAGTADYAIGTANMWDDNQLQVVLDDYRVDIYRLPLCAIADLTGGGSVVYKEYKAEKGRWWEKTTGGSVFFIVETSDGSVVGTASYSVDYQRGIVTFGADQKGTAYYLTGRYFKINASAAEVWRRKAGYAAKAYSFSTDGHSFQRSQFHDHCLKMANYYDSQEADLAVLQVRRSDMDA